MGKGWLRSEWLKQIAVAAGYVIAYQAVHPVSTNAQFALGSGLRLIWLLFLPYRFWPTLVVGEFFPNFLAVYPCLDQLGPLWVVVRTVPPIAVMMPVVWYCREWMGLFPSKRLINIKALLTSMLGSSLALTAYSFLAIAMASSVPGALPATPSIAFCYFAGYYFAMLALAPWPLMARYELRTRQWRKQIGRALESRLLLEGMTVMLPATVFLAIVSSRAGESYSQLVLMAMFLPVTWLTLRHGWRAAALGGTITIVCAAIVLPNEVDKVDVEVIQTELFLAVTITSLFALGTRISAQLREGRKYQHESMSAKSQARQGYSQIDQRLRQTAQALEYVAGTLHVTNGRLLQHIRRIYPHIESESFYKQAVAAHSQVFQLAENLHPIAWRERGLPAALQETIGRALEEAGIAYQCDIKGRGFTRMQPAVLAAAYRSACEAVVYVASRLACSSLHLTIRGGETNGARWVFVGVEGAMENASVVRSINAISDRRQIAVKLGAMGLDISELRDHVRLFDGCMHQNAEGERMRLSILMHDARMLPREDLAPVRQWWAQ
ncbi:hypothetical protein EO087_02200 [Dyella sp. M7H15-1]|uniref:MASE1 domain-containing protein n=1 Tax=Dyella sp. M7H15-1 TaxID=2501295 RepID=UPI001004E54F|nr:MASE1 domain-containing protein [Dyella sp. M7H15-1]QAU22949.1 hypothetical protein EO087_02200 [Dyella sp. M7H15-1]